MGTKSIATSIAVAPIVALIASAVVLGTGRILYGWVPGVPSQYAISEGMSNLLGWGSCLAGASILLLLARLGLPAFAVSILTLPIPVFVVIFSEISDYPTSHNLIPFEIAIYLIGSTALHVPAFGLWVLLTIRAATSNPPMQTDGPSGRP